MLGHGGAFCSAGGSAELHCHFACLLNGCVPRADGVDDALVDGPDLVPFLQGTAVNS